MNMVKRSSKMKGIFAVFFSLMLTLAMMPVLPFGGDAVYATTTHEFKIANGSATISDGTNADTVKVSQTGQTDQDNIPVADTITLTSEGTTTANTVIVTTTHSITIVLKNLSIDVHSNDDTCAFQKTGNGKLTLELAGTNVLNSGKKRAGIEKNGYNTGELVIKDHGGDTSIGKLKAMSGDEWNGIGAGIGSRSYPIVDI